MTREEKQKAIDALKISAPIMAVSQEEFNDYIQTLNKIIDWLEQEKVSKESYDHEYFLRKEFELKIDKLQRQHDKIRAEIEEKADGSVGEIADGLYDALEIIDKYKYRK